MWHSVTACKAPCTASTGVAYPLADAAVQFDSGQLGDRRRPRPPGSDTWSTPTDLDPGTYTYFCRVHPFMRGAFRVRAAGVVVGTQVAAITSGSARTSAGVPSAITRPASRQ